MSESERQNLIDDATKDLQTKLGKKVDENGKIAKADVTTIGESWKKEHDIVEGASVVDGGTTWDIKADLGDKSQTVKGKAKVEGGEGDAEKIKEDNKDAKAGEITAEDKQLHKDIVKKIKQSFDAVKNSNEGLSLEELHKKMKAQGKVEEDKHQPKFKKGINLTISFKPISEDDKDIDIHIKIAPNNEEADLSYTQVQSKFDELIEKYKNTQGIGYTDILKEIAELKTKTKVEIKRLTLDNYKDKFWKIKIVNLENEEENGTVEIKRKQVVKAPEETLEYLILRLKKDYNGDEAKQKQLSDVEGKIGEMLSLADKSGPPDVIKQVGDFWTEIQELLLNLIDSVQGLPKPKYSFTLEADKAKTAEAETLSANRVMGQKPFADPKGWKYLQQGLTKGGGNFVRMHLINMKFGGPGTVDNLVPEAAKYNGQTENQFDSKIKEKIGPQPINSAKSDSKYNKVVWIKTVVNYFTDNKFPSTNKPPLIGSEEAKPSWFAQSIEFTSGDYKKDGDNWKPQGAKLNSTLKMDLPQWDAAEKLSLRYVYRKQLIEVAKQNGEDPSFINRPNMGILRELTFKDVDSLKKASSEYLFQKNELTGDQKLSFRKFIVVVTRLVNNDESGLQI